MIPTDHVLLDAAKLPAIVVVRLPGGFTHFVVLWRKHANTVQVMDPVTGRRWVSKSHFISELYRHTVNVPADDWREFAGSADFQLGLVQAAEKPRRQCISENGRLRTGACEDTAVACNRCSRCLGPPGHVSCRGQGNRTQVEPLDASLSASAILLNSFRPDFWSVRESGGDELAMTGAVLVRIVGRRAPSAATALPRELSAAINERPIRPVWALWQPAGSRWPMVSSFRGLYADHDFTRTVR